MEEELEHKAATETAELKTKVEIEQKAKDDAERKAKVDADAKEKE